MDYVPCLSSHPKNQLLNNSQYITIKMNNTNEIKQFNKYNFKMTDIQSEDGILTFYSNMDNITIRFHFVEIDKYDNPFIGYEGLFFEEQKLLHYT